MSAVRFTLTSLVALRRASGFKTKIGIIEREGLPPILSFATFRDGERRSRFELRPEDLDDVQAALDAFKKSVLASTNPKEAA